MAMHNYPKVSVDFYLSYMLQYYSSYEQELKAAIKNNTDFYKIYMLDNIRLCERAGRRINFAKLTLFAQFFEKAFSRFGC